MVVYNTSRWGKKSPQSSENEIDNILQKLFVAGTFIQFTLLITSLKVVTGSILIK
jgi:hypothetical protein